MSPPEDSLTILTDLLAFVEAQGTFPERARFMVKHQARLAAFDALEKERLVGRLHSRTVWTIQGLQCVAESIPFAAASLRRGQRLLEELKALYTQDLDKVQPLSVLCHRLGWDLREVRRSLMLLQSFAIFHQFSVEIPGYAEAIGLTDGVLRLDTSIFDKPEAVDEPMTDHDSDEFDLQALARGARDLFVEAFATPYRKTGRVGAVGPRNASGRQLQQALLRYEYLERRDLIDQTGPRHFCISDQGKELALRNHGLDQALGIEPSRAPGQRTGFDPNALRLRAKAIFEEYFSGLDRDINVIPDDDESTNALEELVRKGLARRASKGGAYLIGPRGVAVCMGEENLDEVLGLTVAAQPPVVAPAPTTIVHNNFHAPVGAVASAPGAAAQGTVTVNNVDAAMSQVIQNQDELGDLADVLLPLLRKTRSLERVVQGEAELTAALAEADELRAFQEAVNPSKSRAAAGVLTSILELVPVVKAAANLVQ